LFETSKRLWKKAVMLRSPKIAGRLDDVGGAGEGRGEGEGDGEGDGDGDGDAEGEGDGDGDAMEDKFNAGALPPPIISNNLFK
jgi:hypothetical protein